MYTFSGWYMCKERLAVWQTGIKLFLHVHYAWMAEGRGIDQCLEHLTREILCSGSDYAEHLWNSAPHIHPSSWCSNKPHFWSVTYRMAKYPSRSDHLFLTPGIAFAISTCTRIYAPPCATYLIEWELQEWCSREAFPWELYFHKSPHHYETDPVT